MDHANGINQLVHSTVRIECETDNGITNGTGYLFNFCEDRDGQGIVCIVTNKHVIKGAKTGTFHLTRVENNIPLLGNYITTKIPDFEKACILHPEEEIDLAVFPIGPVLNQLKNSGQEVYAMSLGRSLILTEAEKDSICSLEEIVMIGYPNGIWDAKHNLPIIRRGITATHAEIPLNGKAEFLIDAACFPGSSGSPVLIANSGTFVENNAVHFGLRIKLLGTLYSGPQHTAEGDIVIVNVPTVSKPMSRALIPNNLGYVIHYSKLLEFEPILAILGGAVRIPSTSP